MCMFNRGIGKNTWRVSASRALENAVGSCQHQVLRNESPCTVVARIPWLSPGHIGSAERNHVWVPATNGCAN